MLLFPVVSRQNKRKRVSFLRPSAVAADNFKNVYTENAIDQYEACKRWPRTASVLVKRKSYREPLDGVFSGNYRTASRQTSRLCLLDRDNARRYVKVPPFLQSGCDVTAHNEEPTCGQRRRRVSSNFKRCF